MCMINVILIFPSFNITIIINIIKCKTYKHIHVKSFAVESPRQPNKQHFCCLNLTEQQVQANNSMAGIGPRCPVLFLFQELFCFDICKPTKNVFFRKKWLHMLFQRHLSVISDINRQLTLLTNKMYHHLGWKTYVRHIFSI